MTQPWVWIPVRACLPACAPPPAVANLHAVVLTAVCYYCLYVLLFAGMPASTDPPILDPPLPDTTEVCAQALCPAPWPPTMPAASLLFCHSAFADGCRVR